MRLAKHQVPRKVKPQSLNFTSEDQPPGSVPTDSSAVVAASAFLRSPHGWPPRQDCHHPEVNSWSDDDDWSFGFICFGVVSLFVFGTLIDKKRERCTPVNFGLVLFEFGLKLWTLYFLRGSFLGFHVFDYLCWLVLFRRGSFYLVITNLFACRSVILILPSKVPKGEIVKSQSWDLFPYWEYVIYWHFWKVPKLILYILIIYLFPV